MTGMRRVVSSLAATCLASLCLAATLCLAAPLAAQSNAPDLTQPQQYTMHKVSSSDPLGTNADAAKLAAGATLTLLDVDGPGTLSHEWFTISSNDPNHLKNLVLRMYWDGEATPSVETPLGDFFGLETGDYVDWHAEYLSVGHERALNCFFPMPFAKHARVTITNEGTEPVGALYSSIEYMQHHHKLAAGTLYFHAQYRQQAPTHGTFNAWKGDGDKAVNAATNTTGAGNYKFLEATGHGHFVGVTLGILQNQDDWWGEGDEMFFVDGEATPGWRGTGGEDYFLGAWGFGGAWGQGSAFSYLRYGAPLVQPWRTGARNLMYRFHTEAPIPFQKSFTATMEHGHANHRSDNWYSVAYWYQAEPHAPFPPLPAAIDRVPTLHMVGGPANSCDPPQCVIQQLPQTQSPVQMQPQPSAAH